MTEWIGLPEDFNVNEWVGYVYIIKCLHTNKKYLGQKKFWKAVKRKPLKGQKRIRRDKVESDWKQYHGSSEKLKADVKELGKHKFERTILMLCTSKAMMNYHETRLQFEHQVLLSPQWYNAIISCRINQNQLPDHMKR